MWTLVSPDGMIFSIAVHFVFCQLQKSIPNALSNPYYFLWMIPKLNNNAIYFVIPLKIKLLSLSFLYIGIITLIFSSWFLSCKSQINRTVMDKVNLETNSSWYWCFLEFENLIIILRRGSHWNIRFSLHLTQNLEFHISQRFTFLRHTI